MERSIEANWAFRGSGGAPRPPTLTEDAIGTRLRAAAKGIRAIIKAQNDAGVWPRPYHKLRGVGPIVSVGDRRVRKLLGYVTDARMLLGEHPRDPRTWGRISELLLRCAWPHGDWYKTPLRKRVR